MNSPATAGHYPAATAKQHVERRTLVLLVDSAPGGTAKRIDERGKVLV